MTPAKRFFSVQKQLLTLFLKGVAGGRVFTTQLSSDCAETPSVRATDDSF